VPTCGRADGWIVGEIDQVFAEYGLFRTTKRVGGGVQDFGAIKVLKFAAS
jgi:predicted phage gp36 major capsid-like protein